jgi:hypothetical protein
MLKEKFIKKMSDSFRGSNETILEDLGDWIDRCQLNPDQLSVLYERIKENYKYKTFPALAEIIKFWEDIYKSARPLVLSPIGQYRKLTETWDVKKIIEKLTELRKKDILETQEIDFMHYWTDLWSEFNILKDQGVKGEQMKDHLLTVKGAIIRKEKFESAFRKEEKKEVEHKRQMGIRPFNELFEV